MEDEEREKKEKKIAQQKQLLAEVDECNNKALEIKK